MVKTARDKCQISNQSILAVGEANGMRLQIRDVSAMNPSRREDHYKAIQHKAKLVQVLVLMGVQLFGISYPNSLLFIVFARIVGKKIKEESSNAKRHEQSQQ